MSTTSKTTIFSESQEPLLSFYRQYDGYFEGHGTQLQRFLKEMVICSEYDPRLVKMAKGMGCLAAQLIANFKIKFYDIIVIDHNDYQEFNYNISFVTKSGRIRQNRVSLVGEGGEETQSFELYSDDILPLKVTKRVQFVYDKENGEQPQWRSLDVTEEDSKYISGFEDGKFKKFLFSRIVGNKIIPA